MNYLTQKELARREGVSERTIRYWLTYGMVDGVRKVGRRGYRRIAENAAIIVEQRPVRHDERVRIQ